PNHSGAPKSAAPTISAHPRGSSHFCRTTHAGHVSKLNSPTMHPIIVIVGPTASGKSDLALSLAEAFRGEIVNYDSVQIFRGFDIGSAKPSLAERQQVPHHMIDIRDPADLFTAGDYSREARAALE